MAVTFNKSKNYYSANFYGKQYTYSINTYGPLADEIAERSFNEKKKLFNLIRIYDDYAIMYIYHVPSGEIFNVYLDKEDIKKIEDYKWHINVPQNSRTYYVANDKVGKLHRYLLDIDNDKLSVDHIDRDGLNNRKENLRIVNTSINKKNMNVRSDNKFGCNGISLEGNSYRVSWQENGKQRSKKFNINKYDNALYEATKFRKEKELENGYL